MQNEIVTTLVAAAANYDLTDLATVHDELSIKATDTSKDTSLARAIAQASQVVAQYCRRIFPVETVSDLVFIDRMSYSAKTRGAGNLQLSRFPVTAVCSVVEDAGLDTQASLVLGADYLVNGGMGRNSGELIRLNSQGLPCPWYSRTVTAQYDSGFGLYATETDDIPATSPYQVTVEQAAAFDLDKGVSYAGGAALVPVAADPAEGQYVVDPATGIYTFAAADQGKSVATSYVYDNFPPSLVDAVLRLITMRISAQGRDPTLMQRDQSPGIGTERYWIGPTPGQRGSLPPDIEALLEPWRVPGFA